MVVENNAVDVKPTPVVDHSHVYSANSIPHHDFISSRIVTHALFPTVLRRTLLIIDA